MLPVSTMVLTGKKEGRSPHKNYLPVSTTVLTGKEKGGPPQKKYLPVSTTVLTGKPEGGRSLKGKKKQLVPMVSIMYLMRSEFST